MNAELVEVTPEIIADPIIGPRFAEGLPHNLEVAAYYVATSDEGDTLTFSNDLSPEDIQRIFARARVLEGLLNESERRAPEGP